MLHDTKMVGNVKFTVEVIHSKTAIRSKRINAGFHFSPNRADHNLIIR
jgi:hypothetical protein